MWYQANWLAHKQDKCHYNLSIYLNFKCYLVHPWEYQGPTQTEKLFH